MDRGRGTWFLPPSWSRQLGRCAPTAHHGPPGAPGAKPGLNLPVAAKGDTPVRREEMQVSLCNLLLTFPESQTPLLRAGSQGTWAQNARFPGEAEPPSPAPAQPAKGAAHGAAPGALALEQAGVRPGPGAPTTYPKPLHWLSRRGGGSVRGGVVLPGRRPALRLKYARPGTPLPGRGHTPAAPGLSVRTRLGESWPRWIPGRPGAADPGRRGDARPRTAVGGTRGLHPLNVQSVPSAAARDWVHRPLIGFTC